MLGRLLGAIRVQSASCCCEVTACAIAFTNVAWAMGCSLSIAAFTCIYLLILALSFARAQVDCPPFTEDLLGTTNAQSTTGLVVEAFQANSGALDRMPPGQGAYDNVLSLLQ